MWLTPLQKAKTKGSYNILDKKSKQEVMLTKKELGEWLHYLACVYYLSSSLLT